MSVKLTPEVYRDVLESMETGIYLVDRDRRILFWNAAAENITGYRRHEVIGRFCKDNILVHCDERGAELCGLACPLTGTMRDGKPRQSDIFLRHKAGYRVPVRVRAAPLRDDDGTIVGAVESFEERICVPDLHFRLNSPVRCGCQAGGAAARGGENQHAHVNDHLEDFAQHGIPFGVLGFQVDNLDHLRETRGPKAAETVLWVAERTLSKCVPPADLLSAGPDGRLVALVADCPGTALARLAEMLAGILSLAAVPWWGDPVTVTFSAGAAMVREGDTRDSILERAEEALVASIAAGGATVTVL